MAIHVVTGAQCSKCFQQIPDVRCVDFDANYDGPAFTTDANGYPHNQIDELILCEPCLRRGAELLEIDPQAMADLEREVERLKGEVNQWREYARGMEDLVPRRPGRPKKVEVAA